MTDTANNAAFGFGEVTIAPKRWMYLAAADPDRDALEALRGVMGAWITQQRYIIDVDARTGRPMQALAYAIHQALGFDDLDAARAAIVGADGHPVWRKCARRHMLVAAANGGRWEYGDPAPVYEWVG
ncbi:hypothetical protein ACQR3W_21905 [Rhodococcus ruber]|uniref:Uncharacterized protein n=1 Tax=Rhodococcus ruber TaxID=1830 RepID=A0A098BJT7_9NOCA|nr:hypothetical protein [Rhodococcus ruber]MCZ4533447.1 hypothetical protein [Rhodococcus ruber]CDZ89019.1 hypothetical protein RHRU231_450186 [Rhodococcus ruber]